MNTVKNTIASLAALTPFWAALHPDFIPVALTVAPFGFTYLFKKSDDDD